MDNISRKTQPHSARFFEMVVAILMPLLTVLTTQSLGAMTQTQEFVKDNGVTGKLHTDHVGQIQFTRGLVPQGQLNVDDFLSEFEFRDDSNLGITAFLDRSLTNHMHQLAPSMTAEELAKSGNYQFAFFVDDKLIYTENLNSGAGLPETKHRSTVMQKPLMSTKNEDSWGRFLWMRFFLREGGEAALANGPNVLRIEMRPYVDRDGIKVGNLIAKGQITLTKAKPAPVTEEQVAVQSIAPDSGWKLSGAKFDRNRIRELNKAIAQKQFKQITSLVVIKDGELLIEEYFNGANRKTLHNPRSVGKTFASAVTGIAIEEGHLKSTDQTLGELYDLAKFANASEKKSAVTLKSLLTMRSGFDGDDSDYDSPGNEERMYPTDDWVKFALDLPMHASNVTGKDWSYFTAGVVLLGDILHKSVPGGLEKYAEAKLFKPLGVTNYKWQYTPQKVANTAGGLQMASLDFARFGQLYKNGGLWNGAQVLPADWVKASLTSYSPPHGDRAGYGYLFWKKEFKVSDKTHEAFLCSGNGGNKIIIFSDLPIVIVVTATAYNQPYAHPQVDRMLQDYVLPAVRSTETSNLKQ